MKASGHRKQTLRVGSRTIQFSNLDKVLWPRDGLTKGDLIKYYVSVATWLIPYLKDRPITLQRWPNGVNAPMFFEKNAPRGLPDWVQTVVVGDPKSEHGRIRYVLCNDVATLAYLANLAAITLHAWISRRQAADHPDWALFDLDPGPSCPLRTLASVALAIRKALIQLGVKPLVKTTGGDGIHLMFRLGPGHSYDDLRDFVEIVSRKVAADRPGEVTLERRIAKRIRSAVYIDYLQVGKGKTIVFPYVVRGRAGAPVSFPLTWSRVEAMARKKTRGDADELHHWTIENVPGLLRRSEDEWARSPARYSLKAPLRKARSTWGGGRTRESRTKRGAEAT